MPKACIVCGKEVLAGTETAICAACGASENLVELLHQNILSAKQSYWSLLEQATRMNWESMQRSHDIPYPDRSGGLRI